MPGLPPPSSLAPPSPLPTDSSERLCAFSSFSCAAMAAPESSEEDETLPVAQLRIVRPAGRGATDLTLPLCARVALVKVKLEHELGVPEADQRLIYGGKVLQDAQTLEDIVGTKEGRQTFHLVVPPPPPAPAPPPVDLDASPEAPQRRPGAGDAAAPGARRAGDAAATTTIDADHRVAGS